jgi:glycosyltransferase involved in cell wall biosynthesis
VSYTGVLGGAEHLLLDWVEALPGPVLACPDGPLAGAARARGVEVTPVRERPIELRGRRAGAALNVAGLGREVAGLVRRLRPGVVVAWNMRALLACTLAMRGQTALLFQHNDLLPSGLAGAAVRRAARRADRVICISQAIATDLGLPGAQVVRPGVDLQRFQPGPGGGAVITLGAIVGWKRPELALEVTARVPGIALRVAGEPLDAAGRQLLERMRSRAAQPDLAGRVELLGRVQDPVEELRAAGCLLHCADREPYGLVLVEALASGVPVVAPAAGGPAEIVDESCGALYPPGDADAAARALKTVLADAGLRAGARARAEREFDRERSRARFRELVEELVA